MNGLILASVITTAIQGAGVGGGASAMTLASDSFADGEYLSKDYTCDGKDLSPELHWTFPDKAESFAVTCEDPDAPGGTFVHWVIYNIPDSVKKLPMGFPKSSEGKGGLQGINDFGESGYNGPCPPKGKPHRYIFTVYAIDDKIADRGLRLPEFKKIIKGHVLGSASITGLYQR
ncbi:MAG TPA: YbhB/YbcL family Raf kinase inhibitor-like protein [Spirochaetota bacterium]|nr:YbhB/YbcL family Raf kinase inhibitor-like protein [Spirochaetota bacterium]HPJ33998.1 YbhB/YbcL family Raf kinase inhibitor-like protein [Spirochaetota bacterium]